MNVDQIILREIHLPLVEPFQISSGTTTERRILLVEVIDRSGASGWGECVAGEMPNYSPETIDIAWLMIPGWVAPRVLGRSFARAAEVHAALDNDFRGHNMSKAAVEMALWALEAEMRGVSLSKLLGGTREKIATGISLGIQKDPAAIAAKAVAAQKQGYRKIKVKIKPGKDVEYIRAVREAVGPEGHVMADANNAYTLDDLPVMKALDAFGLMMIEQPLAWDDVVQHAKLQRELRTAICLDESITGVAQALDMIELGSGRIVNIKAGRVGGFAESIAIHDLCQKHGVPVWCGGMLESGIGRAHNVALASLPNFSLPGDVSPSARYWSRDVVTPEWTMDREGFVRVPVDKPGLGVTVDRKRVEELCVRMETIENH
jgi:O-succinylbenzoate synthase